MRLFVAFGLPARAREEIHRATTPLQERDFPVHWLPPESYHVTLKFLGEVRDDRAEDVADVVEEVAAGTAPMELRFGGFGAFPTLRRPSVVWIGVVATPELRCLKQDLEWALSEEGFPRDARAFHPHVTVGRVGSDAGGGAFRGLDELAADLDWETTVEMESLGLHRSHLSSEGARYTVVRDATLEAASAGR